MIMMNVKLLQMILLTPRTIQFMPVDYGSVLIIKRVKLLSPLQHEAPCRSNLFFLSVAHRDGCSQILCYKDRAFWN
jgi:hypothetical protein